MKRIVLRYGCPDKILSDNGKEFKYEMVSILCNRLKIEKKFSSPYRPQTNGLVERTNRTLIAIISKYVHEFQMEWDTCLEDIQFQYNIRPQESLGFSPFELLYGRKPNMPVMMNTSDLHEYANERKSRISNRQMDVLKKKREIQRRNAKSIKTRICIGDVVYYKNLSRKTKFDEKWIRPYVVVKVLKCGSYEIKEIKTGKCVVSHWSNIKPVYSDDEFKMDVNCVEDEKSCFD
jgi:hypothetical protein